jgi:dipeptidyl aminopeptidase/acylaminoacyl peptidase
VELPEVVTSLVLAPPRSVVSLSPDARTLLVARPHGPPTLAEMAEKELRLAGVHVDPLRHGESCRAYYIALTLLDVSDASQREVAGLPQPLRVDHFVWSPDGAWVALDLVQEHEHRLWLLDVRAASARPCGACRLNSVAGVPLEWMPDSQSVLCTAVPPGYGPPPDQGERAARLEEVVVYESGGRVVAARTFPDLLASSLDEELFEYYLTTQLMRVDLRGESQPLGPPGMWTHVVASPDGQFLLVRCWERPFSRRVPAAAFPARYEVWDRDGLQRTTLASLPLAEEVPPISNAVRPGRRWFGWRSDAPAELVGVEALDHGDPRRAAPHRDRLFRLEPPFDGPGEVLLDLELRLHSVAWCHGDLALVGETWWKRRRHRMWCLQPQRRGAAPRLLFDRSFEDRYNAPGHPMTRCDSAGHRRLVCDPSGETVFFVGAGASPSGSRPFVDTWHIPSGQVRRIWQSQPPWYDVPLQFLDAGCAQLLVTRESTDQPPNALLLTLAETPTGSPAGLRAIASSRMLTHFPHPTPALRDAKPEVLRYTRSDGVACFARLYVPPGYQDDAGRLPLLVWAYPVEYKDPDAAGQLTLSPFRFVPVYPWSPLIWLTQGYAVLYGPSMPVVGPDDQEPNDRLIEQLVDNAAAAVRAVVERGVADPERAAIGGHSYGAFMAVNLLAHSELFCAGIALSGAYNRTLTPFGFQTEDRTLWQAPEVYWRVSPLMHADRIRRPLLLVHGRKDENPGTWPQQSEWMFQALQGHGAVARLVLLPYEGHVYQARESLLRLAQEVFAWLETHVKHRGS